MKTTETYDMLKCKFSDAIKNVPMARYPIIFCYVFQFQIVPIIENNFFYTLISDILILLFYWYLAQFCMIKSIIVCINALRSLNGNAMGICSVIISFVRIWENSYSDIICFILSTFSPYEKTAAILRLCRMKYKAARIGIKRFPNQRLCCIYLIWTHYHQDLLCIIYNHVLIKHPWQSGLIKKYRWEIIQIVYSLRAGCHAAITWHTRSIFIASHLFI